MKLNNKKGNAVLAVIVTVFIVFTMATVTLVLQEPLEEIKDEILNDPDSSNESKEIITDQQTNYANSWDGIIVFILAMLWIFGIVSSFFIDSHPFFFVLAILMILIAFYVVAILANDFQVFIADPNISPYATANYSYTVWIMEHMLEISIFMAFSFMVALYAKFRGGGVLT